MRTKRGGKDPVPGDIEYNDAEYWAKPTDEWHLSNHKGKPLLTDAAILEREQRFMAAAEAEDAAAGGDAAERLRGRGIMLSFLVAFTYAHDCWDWPSWRVQRDIIRPATEQRRCRYAELPGMAPFVGAATVFMSHCWGSTWGGLVMAACAGAREDRVVWIDMFAVRAEEGGKRRGALRGDGLLPVAVRLPPVGLARGVLVFTLRAGAVVRAAQAPREERANRLAQRPQCGI